MAYTRTGRPRGRPKTADTLTVMARIPRDLAERVQHYAAVHRQSISELIRDGLELRLEAGDVPGRPSFPAHQPAPPDTFPMPAHGDPLAHALTSTRLTDAHDAIHDAIHALQRVLSHDPVIQQTIPVLQPETGKRQLCKTAEDFDLTKCYLGKLCKRGHDYQGTGKSLLRKANQNCVVCSKERKREARALKKVVAQEG